MLDERLSNSNSHQFDAILFFMSFTHLTCSLPFKIFNFSETIAALPFSSFHPFFWFISV